MANRIDRMIAEIQSFLALPLKDSESFWEKEERRSLRELLEHLKQQKATASERPAVM
jgi:hypothetical protein